MIKIFATDLDGTLLFPKKKIRLIALKNRKFLRKLSSKGVKVVFVTGRNLAFCQKVEKKLKIPCDFISDSGARITLNHQNLKLSLIDNEIAKDISDSLRKNSIKAVMAISTTKSQIYSDAWAKGKLWEMMIKTYSLKDLVLSERVHVSKKTFNRNINIAKILKITIIFMQKYEESTKEFMEQFLEKYPNKLEYNYGKNYLEITTYDSNKATSLVRLMEEYGYSKEEVVVAGDEGNDYEMILNFPNSFAMAKGSELIKGVAKYVINDITEIEQYIKI